MGKKIYLVANTNIVCNLPTLRSTDFSKTVRLWSLRTSECLQTFIGHADKVCSVAFSKDGKTIASGSQDQSVRLWNTATGECRQVLQPKRLYESMNITGVTGLTFAQQKTLPILGAIWRMTTIHELKNFDKI